MRKGITWVVIVVVCGTTLLHLSRDGPSFVLSADYWFMLTANLILYVGLFYLFRGITSRHNK